VVQPLPRERYSSNDSCVGDWTFGVPDVLDQFGPLAALLPNRSPGNWINDYDSLKKYLEGGAHADTGPGLGLLLLAHHDEGKLWFETVSKRINREQIHRRFPPHSVGIFAACSMASSNRDNSALLNEFNERGVDAIIATPFAIPADYGTRLAIQFTSNVTALRQSKGNRPTIVDLFNESMSTTAKLLNEQFKGKYEEIGLEYVLLGNPMITLCEPAAAPK
jgi:hypothetical protein